MPSRSTGTWQVPLFCLVCLSSADRLHSLLIRFPSYHISSRCLSLTGSPLSPHLLSHLCTCSLLFVTLFFTIQYICHYLSSSLTSAFTHPSIDRELIRLPCLHLFCVSISFMCDCTTASVVINMGILYLSRFLSLFLSLPSFLPCLTYL